MIEGKAHLPNLAAAQVFCIEYNGVYTEFIIASSVPLLQLLLPCFGLAIMRELITHYFFTKGYTATNKEEPYILLSS